MQLSPQHKLRIVKVLHTLIWAFFVVTILYVLYSGIFDQITRLTWFAVILVILEGVTLIIFGMSCPLTIIARRYSDSSKDNFDIYLPNWLARHNKLIFTSIFVIALAIVLFRAV